MSITRRRFLKDGTAIAAGLSSGGLIGCASEESLSRSPSPDDPAAQPDPPATSPFKHGVASGDPLSDRVMLWTRISEVVDTVTVRWRVYSDADLTREMLSGTVQTDAACDWTVKVDAAGLNPATSYYYQFEVLGWASPAGRTRTLPTGATDRVRLGLVSCSNYSTGYFNAYKVLAQRDVDAVLHVGDYFYEGGGAGSLGRAHEPAYEIVSLDDYRQRHAQYRTDGDLQEMSRQHPLIVVWDDHESTNNSWIDGAQNHQPETEGDWQVRKANAVQAYAEWLPIRLPEPDNPLKIWRRFQFGDLVDLFMLDTRLQRNTPETDTSITGTDSFDPARSMLGLEQRDWLLDGLRDSVSGNRRWRVLGQQTMMAPHRNNPDPTVLPLPYLPPAIAESIGIRPGGGNEGSDNWGAYGYERDLILGTLRDEQIANNIVLSGDIHTAWACDVVEDPYTPFNPLTPTLTGVPGYEPLTGQGSVAVEFTCMSVTSNNLADDEQLAALAPLYNAAIVGANPNIPYHNSAAHGFVLLDITRDAVQGEHWNVGSVLAPFADTDDASLDTAHRASHGSAGSLGTDHLVRTFTPTEDRQTRPSLAPRLS
ncbi:alkaline phosphatase [Abyssibacter sp.]|uniref:alkaline phosphatase D family protein n=1 Tax=Abyssibacter sp. TaxID=2320200 RepID=UPI00351211D2